MGLPQMGPMPSVGAEVLFIAMNGSYPMMGMLLTIGVLLFRSLVAALVAILAFARQKKPLSYMNYKERSNPNAHMRQIEKTLSHNGEAIEQVIIKFFGMIRLNKVGAQYEYFLENYLYYTWQDVKAAYRRMYRTRKKIRQFTGNSNLSSINIWKRWRTTIIDQ